MTDMQHSSFEKRLRSDSMGGLPTPRKPKIFKQGMGMRQEEQRSPHQASQKPRNKKFKRMKARSNACAYIHQFLCFGDPNSPKTRIPGVARMVFLASQISTATFPFNLCDVRCQNHPKPNLIGESMSRNS